MDTNGDGVLELHEEGAFSISLASELSTLGDGARGGEKRSAQFN